LTAQLQPQLHAADRAARHGAAAAALAARRAGACSAAAGARASARLSNAAVPRALACHRGRSSARIGIRSRCVPLGAGVRVWLSGRVAGGDNCKVRAQAADLQEALQHAPRGRHVGRVRPVRRARPAVRSARLTAVGGRRCGGALGHEVARAELARRAGGRAARRAPRPEVRQRGERGDRRAGARPEELLLARLPRRRAPQAGSGPASHVRRTGSLARGAAGAGGARPRQWHAERRQPSARTRY